MERQAIKAREKNKKEREVDFSSRFHVDARIGWLLEMAGGGYAMSEVEETWIQEGWRCLKDEEKT